MGTRLRLLLSFILAFVLFTNAKGQTKAVNNSTAPTKADDSQQAVILEQAINRVAFQSDGTGTHEISERIRVQSEAGVQALGVLSFAYTTSNQTLDVDYVRVRKPDGTVVTTPAYNIQDMPSEVTRSAPMYSDIYEKHIVVKGLAAGDELEYLIRYRTVKPEVPGQFWYEHTFPRNVIAKDEELQIRVPRDKYVKVSSPDMKPEVKEDAETRLYTWKTANVKVDDDGDKALPGHAPPPSVQLTTFHSWDEVGRWYSQLQGPQAEATPAIRAKAEELTKGLTGDEAKIRALYGYVAGKFHYVSLSFGIGRYQPHSAEEVLGNEYGDCKDKHTLLQALLQAAGYDAYPALINSTRKLDPEVPSPAQFDHVITAVLRETTLQWLDTTTEVAPLGMLTPNLRDKQALLILGGKPAELVSTPANPPFATNDLFAANAKLAADGTLTGHIEYTVRGDAELLLRLAFRHVPEAQWKTLVQRISYATGFGGEVSAITASTPDDTTKPFHYAYDYTRKDFGDWKDRLITPPMPPFGVEAQANEDTKPAQPVVLGPPGQIVHRARVELPSGYQAKLPKNVDLVTDFAEYHSVYSLKDGVLNAKRQLVVKKDKVPLAQWDAFRNFGKAISDDENSWVTLNRHDTNAGNGSNAEADRIFQEGYSALQMRDLTTAAEDFRKLIRMDPKYAYGHADLGVVYLIQNNAEDGLAELRTEEELHPDNTFSYRTMARELLRLHRNDEAMQEWRKLLQADPKDRDAALALSGMLMGTKKYADAIAVLEPALKLSPDSEALQAGLGFAYLRAGRPQEGVSLLKKVVQADPNPESLNDVAYEMADANLDLEDAQAYAEKAVQQTEAQSLSLSASSPEALKITAQVGAFWDTLGWVYFRRGELSKAESYLRAAWDLSQISVMGDHLAQVYERQGRKSAAEHMFSLALAAAGGDKDEVRQHYRQLTGKSPDEQPVMLRRGRNGARIVSPGEELSRVRETKLSSSSHLSGSATYALAFSPGKVGEVTYISGDASLKSVADGLSHASFHVEFPAQDPVKLVRRGILMCGTTGCDFVLLPSGDAASATRSGR